MNSHWEFNQFVNIYDASFLTNRDNANTWHLSIVFACIFHSASSCQLFGEYAWERINNKSIQISIWFNDIYTLFVLFNFKYLYNKPFKHFITKFNWGKKNVIQSLIYSWAEKRWDFVFCCFSFISCHSSWKNCLKRQPVLNETFLFLVW